MFLKSCCKNTITPFVLILLAVFIRSQSISQVSGKVKGPLEVKLSAACVHSNSVLFIVRCLGHFKFTEGTLIFEVGSFRSKSVDTLHLWSGNSDTNNFDQTFNYTLRLPEGKKANVAATFQARVTGLENMYAVKGDLCVYQLPDTLLQAEGEYNFLDWVEIDYLIKKKGYDGKSEDEIRAIDPNFWKRIQYVKHGHGRKNKK